MNQEIQYALVFLVLLAVELIYFKIADQYEIVDKPNARSSHSGRVIRGGGIVFLAAIVVYYLFFGFAHCAFVLGAVSVAAISFLDDIRPQKPVARFLVQLMAVSLMFYSSGVFAWDVWLVAIAIVVCVGSLNAFNFMDGINGITGVYALVNLITLLYVQVYVEAFAPVELIVAVIFSVLIFLFFNFRKKAKCFAGDVGSVTLAYVQVFLVLLLIIQSNNFFWVIIFLVFGVDSIVTILYRLAARENIFEGHRTHLYQYLSNESGLSHRLVATAYGLIQLAINVTLIYFLGENNIVVPMVVSLIFVIAYLLVRILIIRKIFATRV